MSDLVVDFATLEDSASTLATLKSEFDNLPSRVGGGDDLWGHHDVTDGMDEFANNWKYHRTKLSEALKKEGEKVESCLKAFKEADQKLYNELKKQADEQRKEKK